MLKRAVAFLCCLCVPAFAASLPRYGIFDYADMCHSSVDGDWDGLRIVIMRLPENDVVYYETGEGGIGMRLVDEAKISRDGSISFDLAEYHSDPKSPPFHFQGRITENALVGKAENDTINLPRRVDTGRGGFNAHCAPRRR